MGGIDGRGGVYWVCALRVWAWETLGRVVYNCDDMDFFFVQ